MINQICPLSHRRPLEAEIMLCCCCYMRMCRLVWMSEAVSLDMYDHLLPRSYIRVRNKHSMRRAHVATQLFAKQVLQWERESWEVVVTCPCQLPQEPHRWFWFKHSAHLPFELYYLVCNYSRKVSLLQKG